MTKFCVDCDNYDFISEGCHAEELGINLVTGIVKSKYASSTRRSTEYCGEEAKWFKPKTKSAWEILKKKLSLKT